MKAISHFLPFLLLLIPIVWGLYGFFKTRNASGKVLPAGRRSAAILVINSAVLYALAFNIIFFIQELFLALGKRWLGLKATLYHNNHNWEGNHPMESLAQGYGAAAIFVAGLIFLFVANRIKRSAHWSHLFILWLAFQGLAQSIPQFITAKVAADTDTGQAFTYLGIGEGLGIVISITGIIAMLYLGILFSKYLLRLSPSIDQVSIASARSGYLFRIAVLASLVGLVLIIPFRIMPWDRAIAPVMVTLISIPMVFAHGWHVSITETINSRINNRIFILPVVLLLILLLIFQLILAKGVPF
ncbi:MAG: hypothetical protein IPO42_02535 [Chitinophagaceae bacterium]|nr:hypothetical protein [Chitinophagaceae bacterium]